MLRRLLSLAFAVLTAALAASAQAPTWIQQTPIATCLSAVTCSATFPGAVLSSDSFLVVASAPAPAVLNVSDNQQDGFGEIGLPQTTAATYGLAQTGVLWSSTAVVGGSTTVTVRLSPANVSSNLVIQGFEYSPTTLLAVSAIGSGSGTAVSVGSLSAAANSTAVLFGFEDVFTATFTAGGSYTLRQGAAGGLFTEDLSFVAPAPTTATGTLSANADWSGFLVDLQQIPSGDAWIWGSLHDLSGATITGGNVVFTLQPGINTTISGLARFTPTTVTCSISSQGFLLNGTLNGPCLISMNVSIVPTGTYYSVSLQPYGTPTSTFNMYATTATENISAAVPTPATMPVYNIVDTFSNQTIAGNKTFTGTVTLSGGSLLVINGPLNANNGGSLGGSYSGNPTFSGNPVFAQFSFLLGGVSQSAIAGNTGVIQDAGTIAAGSGHLLCTDSNSNDTTTGCPTFNFSHNGQSPIFSVAIGAPTMCGAGSPVTSGTNNAFTYSPGVTLVSACTVNFGTPNFTVAPVCTVTLSSDAVTPSITAVSTSSITFGYTGNSAATGYVTCF